MINGFPAKDSREDGEDEDEEGTEGKAMEAKKHE